MPPEVDVEYDVFITCLNRETGSLRPVFYYITVKNGRPTATQIARGNFILGDGLSSSLPIVWMRHHGFLNSATNHDTSAG